MGRGLFVDDPVRRYHPIVEYTGNRVSGHNLRRMTEVLDYHGINLDRQVAVPSEDAIVDPRGCGNVAQFVNHSCAPNARLVEVDVCGKTIVVIVALRDLEPGEEVLIDYGYFSSRPGVMGAIRCLCGTPSCRIWI